MVTSVNSWSHHLVTSVQLTYLHGGLHGLSRTLLGLRLLLAAGALLFLLLALSLGVGKLLN